MVKCVQNEEGGKNVDKYMNISIIKKIKRTREVQKQYTNNPNNLLPVIALQ